MTCFDLQYYPPDHSDSYISTLPETFSDVEKGAPPPSYPLHESEELVVGGPKPRRRFWKFFRNRRCDRRTDSCSQSVEKRRKITRALKWLFSAWILLGLFHFVAVGVEVHKSFNTVECTTITPGTGAEELEFTLPLAHKSSGIFVHDSLTAENTQITHDSAIANGTVKLTVKLPEDANEGQVFDGCLVQWKHGTSIALIPRGCHGSRAKIASMTFQFPESLTAPAVQFIGHNKHLSDRKLRKLIRWWRKHYEQKGL